MCLHLPQEFRPLVRSRSNISKPLITGVAGVGTDPFRRAHRPSVGEDPAALWSRVLAPPPPRCFVCLRSAPLIVTSLSDVNSVVCHYANVHLWMPLPNNGVRGSVTFQQSRLKCQRIHQVAGAWLLAAAAVVGGSNQRWLNRKVMRLSTCRIEALSLGVFFRYLFSWVKARDGHPGHRVSSLCTD